jgi:hypothetical protein
VQKNVTISLNLLGVMLASRMVPILIGLAEIQIRMQFLLLVILVMDAGLPERAITLKCLKEPFDQK